MSTGYHTLAVNTNGALSSWGFNTFGALGLGDTTGRSSPVQVGTSFDVGLLTYGTFAVTYRNVNTTSTSSMNTFILDVQSAYSLLSQRRQADTNFYVNSLSVLNDYQTLVQFNNLGATQDYLINNYIGTDKLKTDLAS
jgi:alpha-tubulin suppressor-like RCC1 family protein